MTLCALVIDRYMPVREESNMWALSLKRAEGGNCHLLRRRDYRHADDTNDTEPKSTVLQSSIVFYGEKDINDPKRAIFFMEESDAIFIRELIDKADDAEMGKIEIKYMSSHLSFHKHREAKIILRGLEMETVDDLNYARVFKEEFLDALEVAMIKQPSQNARMERLLNKWITANRKYIASVKHFSPTYTIKELVAKLDRFHISRDLFTIASDSDATGDSSADTVFDGPRFGTFGYRRFRLVNEARAHELVYNHLWKKVEPSTHIRSSHLIFDKQMQWYICNLMEIFRKLKNGNYVESRHIKNTMEAIERTCVDELERQNVKMIPDPSGMFFNYHRMACKALGIPNFLHIIARLSSVWQFRMDYWLVRLYRLLGLITVYSPKKKKSGLLKYNCSWPVIEKLEKEHIQLLKQFKKIIIAIKYYRNQQNFSVGMYQKLVDIINEIIEITTEKSKDGNYGFLNVVTLSRDREMNEEEEWQKRIGLQMEKCIDDKLRQLHSDYILNILNIKVKEMLESVNSQEERYRLISSLSAVDLTKVFVS